MRAKTLVRRPELCRSPHPIKPISTMRTRLPVLEMSEDNGEDASGSEIGSESEEDSLTVNYQEICIKCDEVGQMLVCSVRDCPVAVHEKCLAFKPRLDDMGNFRCPYCWYKQALKKKRELRKKVMLAKNALSDFINFKVVEDDQEKMKDGKAKENGENTSQLDCCDHDKGVEDEEQAEPSNTCCVDEEIVVDVSLHMPGEGTKTADMSQDKQGIMEKEEQTHPEAAEDIVLSAKENPGLKVPADDSYIFEASDSDTQAPLVHTKPTKQRSKMKVGRKNVDPSKKPLPQMHKKLERRAKNQIRREMAYLESSYQLNVVSSNESRKRARWTQEEEDILKEGVQRFSSDKNVNFPWKKVLEFGRNVFNPSRTSTDLKEKWKRL